MNLIEPRTLAERGTNMKRTHLIAVIVGIVAVGIFAADASAMYNPGMGGYMQRDPGAGSAMRVGGGSAASVGKFIPRDTTRRYGQHGQYADGMNLHQYCRDNPLRWRDPSGLKVVANCSASELGKWSAIAIDYGITAGQDADPDVAAKTIKIAAILEFLGSVSQNGQDLIGSTVESVASGDGPTGGFPAATIAVTQLLQKIIQDQRAFMWVQLRCFKCECDKDGSSGNAWHIKHDVWHQATFSDINTGDLPRDRFGLDKDIVQTVSSLNGLIQLRTLKKGDLEDLKLAAKWEAWFKADNICSKSAK